MRFFSELANGLFYRKSINKKEKDHILRVRETELPTQTLVFAKTAVHHNLVEVIFFPMRVSGEFAFFCLCLFINCVICTGIGQNLKGTVLKSTGCPKSSFLYFKSLYFSTIGLGIQIISTKVVSFNIIHYFHTFCAIF